MIKIELSRNPYIIYERAELKLGLILSKISSVRFSETINYFTCFLFTIKNFFIYRFYLITNLYTSIFVFRNSIIRKLQLYYKKSFCTTYLHFEYIYIIMSGYVIEIISLFIELNYWCIPHVGIKLSYENTLIYTIQALDKDFSIFLSHKNIKLITSKINCFINYNLIFNRVKYPKGNLIFV